MTLNGVIVGFIIFFLIVIGLYMRVFLLPLKKRCKELKGIIQSLSIYNSNTAVVYFERINQGLQNAELLRPSWQKYQKSLVKLQDEQGGKVYSTVDAEEFFSFVTITKGLYAESFSGMAGIFTGIGILGTFVGLTAGLWGMDTGDAAALAEGIKQILNGSGTAFVTSIIGIICGLVFIFVHSIVVKRVQHNIDSFCDTLDQLFPRTTIEILLQEQITINKKVSGAVEQLSVDIATSICEKLPTVLDQIADRIDRSLKGNLDAVIDGLSQKLEVQIEELRKIESNTAELNHAGLSGIGTTISKIAGKGMANFGESLNLLASDLKGISADMKSVVEEFKRTGMESNEELLKAVKQSAGNMANAVQQMQDRQTQKNEENIQKMTVLMDDMKGTMESIFVKMQDQSTILTGNVTEMNEATEAHMTKMNASMEELLANMAEKIQLMQMTMEQHEHEIHQTMEKMQSAASISGDVVTKAGNTIQVFDQVTDSMTHKFNDAAETVSMTLEDAADQVATHMKNAVEPIQSVAETMTANVSQLMAVNQGLSEVVEKNVELLAKAATDNHQSVKEIQVALANVQNSWGAYEDHFGKVSGEVERSFVILEKGIAQYNKTTNDGLREKLKWFDDKLGHAINGLAGVASELNDTAEELKENRASYRG